MKLILFGCQKKLEHFISNISNLTEIFKGIFLVRNSRLNVKFTNFGFKSKNSLIECVSLKDSTYWNSFYKILTYTNLTY